MDFSTLAHDLGTPLTVMLGYTQLLAAEDLTEAGRRRLGVLEAQMRRMTELIERYLTEGCVRSGPHTSAVRCGQRRHRGAAGKAERTT